MCTAVLLKALAPENEIGNRKRRVPAPEVDKPTSLANNNSFQSRLSGVSDTISLLSGSLAPDDGIPDANSEKELVTFFFLLLILRFNFIH